MGLLKEMVYGNKPVEELRENRCAIAEVELIDVKVLWKIYVKVSWKIFLKEWSRVRGVDKVRVIFNISCFIQKILSEAQI